MKKTISGIKAWMLWLLLAISVCFPNMAWTVREIFSLDPFRCVRSILYLFFHILFFGSLIGAVAWYGRHAMQTLSALHRLMTITLMTLGGFGLYGLTMGLPGAAPAYSTDILISQFIFVFVIETGICHVLSLTHQQRQQEEELQQMRDELGQLYEKKEQPNLPEAPCPYPSAMLVPVRDKLLPLTMKEMAFIYSSDRNTQIYMQNAASYSYNKSLDAIMSTLDPRLFYRANKQFIVNRSAVKELVIWFDSRLLLHMSVEPPEPVYVSKNKAAEFKQWMT